MFNNFISGLQKEFSGYNGNKFAKDFKAGLNVAAVSLPLALALGIACGADAAAGLITAILSGIVVTMLSSAEYQISGPTSAMTAVLASIAIKYSIQGIFIAGFLAGIILILAGLFKLGRLMGFIPTSVITGFTSGIACLILIGQLDSFFGIKTQGATAIDKIQAYAGGGFSPETAPMLIGISVILLIALCPKKLAGMIPVSLAALVFVTIMTMIFGLDVKTVGNIPATLLPENRLSFSGIPWSDITGYISPAFTIAALCMIESLLCGISAAKMKDNTEVQDSNRELFAQGFGNILMPFFGGIPTAAVIARTSVAIKSEAQTRLSGIISSAGLLCSMFFLSFFMSRIPLSALAGVLIITAWRMNDWTTIKYFFNRGFKSSIFKFLLTMTATVVFDLTTAILIGVTFSIILFVVRISDISIEIQSIAPERLGLPELRNMDDIKVVYFTGPLFFAGVNKLKSNLKTVYDHTLILSMRGCPFIDISGVSALFDLLKEVKKNNAEIYLTGIAPKVRQMLDRSGITEQIGEDNFFFDAKMAIDKIISERQ